MAGLRSPILVKATALCTTVQNAARPPTLMGVVRQDVNTSAGRSGFCGSSSDSPQAHSRIQSRMGSGRESASAEGHEGKSSQQ